jgi:hypothetical protein
MKTVTLKSAIWGTARRLGLSPETADLDAETAARICEALERWVRKGVEHELWPELLVCEERYYRATWDASTTYATGDIVWSAVGEGYYTALQASTNKEPSTETTYWEEAEDWERYVELEQTGETEIGSVEGVYERNPWTTRYPGRLDFELTGKGVYPSDLAGDTIWIVFRVAAPKFSVTDWSSATTYAAGELVYLAATGECYKALAASTNRNPSSETAYWSKVDFPAFLADYAILGATGDLMESEEGRVSQGAALKSQAMNELVRLVDVATIQQEQSKRAKVLAR